ncbi:hypothetical protein QTP88_000160 [Uroleucon formosanum]
MNNRSDDKDEFETVAKETLDKIIEILEQDEINNTGSELIESVELDKLVEELDTFDEEIFNDKVGNKPISSDVLNKSLRLINLDEFENSPTINVTRQGLRSNRNTIHTEYIQPKRTVKTKKMTGGSEMKPLNAIEAIKLIPDYSGQTEIYPFLNACEVIINTVDVDQQPFMLKMIAATKLSDRAFNATRYKEIKVWEDMKKILLDAFETPYAAANLQIELNIIKMRYDETICAYNNRVEEIYQKLCNAVAIDKTPAEAKILRNNIREQALVSYINGLNDKLKFEVKTKNPTTLEQAMQIAIIAEKNIRTYNDVQEIFRTKNTSKSTKFYKAGKNERIQDFAGRIEKIYHELTYASTIGKNATESKIIAQTIQGQASSVFMSGVHPAINTILEARAVTTFELAVVIAMEKERNFEDRKSGYDKNKNIKNKIKCNRCNKMGHYANECYSKVTASSGFRNPTYNDIKKENTGQVKFCKYCRKTNHDIKDCRKRIFNENKKKQEGGYTPSNETNRTADFTSISAVKNHSYTPVSTDDQYIGIFDENSPLEFSYLGPYDTNSVTEAITSQPKPHTFYEVENDQQHTSYENITSEKQLIPKLIETSMPQKKLPKVSKTREPRKKLFENINDLTNHLLSSYSTKESFIILRENSDA